MNIFTRTWTTRSQAEELCRKFNLQPAGETEMWNLCQAAFEDSYDRLQMLAGSFDREHPGQKYGVFLKKEGRWHADDICMSLQDAILKLVHVGTRGSAAIFFDEKDEQFHLETADFKGDHAKKYILRVCPEGYLPVNWQQACSLADLNKAGTTGFAAELLAKAADYPYLQCH